MMLLLKWSSTPMMLNSRFIWLIYRKKSSELKFMPGEILIQTANIGFPSDFNTFIVQIH